MYRITEEIARKILTNIRNPEIGPLDITQADPFTPKNMKSIGIIDPYCCIGTEFPYILEFPLPFLNPRLPPIPVLEGYWLYKRSELFQPFDPLTVPRYLVDPNVKTNDDVMDVTDCSIQIPSDVDKLTCISILSFEKLIEHEPLILDCLQEKLK